MGDDRAFRLGAGLDSVAGGPISVAPFVSDAYFEREKALWRQSWLAVGREADVAKPNSYFTADIDVVHASVIVVRGKDGALRAFHNVCTHRAGRILCDTAKKGRAAFLTCPFHGWVFDTDGELRNIPKEGIFTQGCDKAALALKPVHVATWGGFVFINLAETPTHSLEQHMAGVPANLEPYLRDRPWTWYAGYRHVFDANWKDLMNIQHEGYHASVLHADTLAVDFAPQDCANTLFPDSPGVSSLLTVSRPVPPPGVTWTPTPIQDVAQRNGRTSNWVDNDTSVASRDFPGAVNHEQSDRWVFDCYTIFPNLLIFVGASVVSVMRVLPISAHQTIWDWDWYFDHAPETFGEKFNLEHGRIATRNALAQDWGIIDLVHANMRAGVVDTIHIANEMEATVAALYERVVKAVPLQEGR